MKSLWLNQEHAATPLDRDFECDIAIIGGGIVGMSSAYHALKAGLRVGVFEKDDLSTGSTGQSGGFLASSTTLDLGDLINKWGDEKGKRIYGSISSAISSISDTVAAHNIDCGFRKCGAFYVAAEKSDFPIIQGEHELLKKSGYKSELFHSGSPGIPVASNFGALKTFSDCAFDPTQFLHGLAEVIRSTGGNIFTKTKIKSLQEKNDLLFLQDESGHTIKTRFVIFATNGFSFSEKPDHAAIQCRSHIMVTKPVAGIRERWHGELIWDTYKLYHYLRLLDDDRILIGGEDSLFAHKEITPEDTRKTNHHLLKKLEEFFPGSKIEVDLGWPGQLSYPLDGIPIIKTEKNITYLITDGMPFGWLLGQMATDRITKGSSPLDDLYDYGRDYGFFENIIIKSKLPNRFKYWALKLGLTFEYAMNSLDERFKG